MVHIPVQAQVKIITVSQSDRNNSKWNVLRQRSSVKLMNYWVEKS
jgi:hypothetical protein